MKRLKLRKVTRLESGAVGVKLRLIRTPLDFYPYSYRKPEHYWLRGMNLIGLVGWKRGMNKSVFQLICYKFQYVEMKLSR